jgi:hypothetical protein
MNRLRLLCALSAALVMGCSGSSQPLVPDAPPQAATPSAPPSTPQQPAEVPTAEAVPTTLPELGDTMELDRGRLTAAGPADWSRPPRDPQWLARFLMTEGTPYPSLLIQQPQEYANQPDVTKDNAAEFARRLQEELRQDLTAQGHKVPEVRPLVLKRFAGAEYSRQAKVQGSKLQLDRLFLVTVSGGRKYTIELQAVHGSANRYRPHALAVAEGLKFHPTETATE